MKKVCSKCKIEKDLGCFCRDKKRGDGLYPNCKTCVGISVLAYNRSLNGKARGLYNSAVKRCRTANSYINREVGFSIEWFCEWIMTTNYSKLHKAWTDSGYNRKLSPSLDRVDNDRGYDIDNIQIITFSENVSKDFSVFGQRHGRSKLTEEQVLKVREMYKAGGYTQKELGMTFSVDRSTVGGIVNMKYWKHI